MWSKGGLPLGHMEAPTVSAFVFLTYTRSFSKWKLILNSNIDYYFSNSFFFPLKIENKIFSKNIFLNYFLLFTYFLKIILKNNYINIKSN